MTESKLKTLSIILLTHNRPLQAYEATLSIAAQNNKNFKLIISDNSSSCSLKNIIDKHTSNFEGINFYYKKRSKAYSAVEHGNLCLNEIDTDYFCFFHDDDLMLPNFVENFWNVFRKYPDLVSCGMNAYIESLNVSEGAGSKLFFNDFRLYLGPVSPKNLIERYFGRHQLGIAPYPSYIYKTDSVRDIQFRSDDGKYGDVTWLLRVAARGSMIWVNSPSMIYRLHDGNDSLSESRKDRLRFLAFLKKNINNFGAKIISDYRFFLYKKNLPELNMSGRHNFKVNILKSYIQHYRMVRWLRFDQHLQLIRKFLIRQMIKFKKLIESS